MERIFCIVINFGTELRPFFDTGLYDELNKHYKVVCFIKKNSLIKFIDCLPEKLIEIYDPSIIIKNNNEKLQLFSKLDFFLRRIRKSRIRRIGYGEYHFTKGSNFKKRLYDYIIGNEFFYTIQRFFYNKLAPWAYFSEEIHQLFLKHKITDVLYYGSNMTEMLLIQHTASAKGLNLWHYVGNWKDIYIDDFIPIQPKKIFVWSEIIKNDLVKFNPWINRKSITISGNWFFYKFKNLKPFFSKSYFFKKYCFDEARKIILWPLSNKVIFPGEYLLLQKVNLFIKKIPENTRPIILIRENAFGSINEHQEIISKLENIRLMENYWLLNREDDFIFQRKEGEQEWLDILYWCDFIVTTPSTITLEAILVGKTIVNILFDETGNYSSKLAAFAAAPFYKSLLSRNDVKLVNNINDFFEMLMRPEDMKLYTLQELPEIIDGNKISNLSTVLESLMQ